MKQRIVSLLASNTEIVCALGLGDQLVGRSHECDYPASVKKLPVCTQPKFDPRGTSREIDQRVKSILKEALSVYSVDGEKLNQLRPDVILTQAQCEVCAVSLKDVEKAVCQVISSRPKIVSLEPQQLSDIWSDIGKVARAVGVAEKGKELVKQFKGRVKGIADKARAAKTKPAVGCIEWLDPLMAAGNWVPELVELASGVNCFGQAGKHSPWMNWGDLLRKNPDILVILPCGFDMEKTAEELPVLTQKPEWKKLKAVQESKVFLADGNQYFNRPGPRLVESLEILAEIFHPELFHFGHEGKGWRKFKP